MLRSLVPADFMMVHGASNAHCRDDEIRCFRKQFHIKLIINRREKEVKYLLLLLAFVLLICNFVPDFIFVFVFYFILYFVFLFQILYLSIIGKKMINLSLK